MEERLMAEYIGKDADKIMSEKINWIAAILGEVIGPVWFFYRKSYLIGFGFCIISYIIGTIASAIGMKDASFIMLAIYLVTANKLYLWDVKRKVNKIMSLEYMSEEQLIETIRKKGGRSVIATVIYIVGFISLIAMYVISILFQNIY